MQVGWPANLHIGSILFVACGNKIRPICGFAGQPTCIPKMIHIPMSMSILN